jgi:hypothetical protein
MCAQQRRHFHAHGVAGFVFGIRRTHCFVTYRHICQAMGVQLEFDGNGKLVREAPCARAVGCFFFFFTP